MLLRVSERSRFYPCSKMHLQLPLPLLPEPLPGQEATLQTLALGEEARCFQGSADLDLIKLSKHKSTEKNTKNVFTTCASDMRRLSHLILCKAPSISHPLWSGTSSSAPLETQPRWFAEEKNMANAQHIHNCGPLL